MHQGSLNQAHAQEDGIMQAKIKYLYASSTEIIGSSLSSLFSAAFLERFLSKIPSIAWPHFRPGSLKELFERIMSPCMRLMAKLDLNIKLLSLFAGFFIVMGVLTVQTLSKLSHEKNSAKEELQGVQISNQIMNVLIQAQKHRGQVNLKLSGQDVDAALFKTRTCA